MAKVVGPLHSTEARGSVGSLTYNTWRGIRTVKTRAGPAGPATGKRLDMLLLGKAASFNWSDISPDQRALWNAFGSAHPEAQWTGDLKRLSGHSWYVRLWVRVTLIDGTPPDSPPTVPNLCDALIVLAAYDGTFFEVDWAQLPLSGYTTYKVELYRTGPTSAGQAHSLHNAVRLGYTGLPSIWFEEEVLAAGDYTVWIRTVTPTGLVGTWSKTRFTV